MISEQEVIDALPEGSWLRRYVLFCMQLTDAHAGFHVLTALAQLTQIMPEMLVFPSANSIPSNLYILLVGSSSDSRKTTAGDIAFGSGGILRKAFPTAVIPTPGSAEAFVDSLSKTPRGICYYAEFATFLHQTEIGYMAPLRATFTNIYDCPTVTRQLVERKDRKPMKPVNNPRFSLLACCAPTFLGTYTRPVDWDGGFLGRHLTFWGERQRSFPFPRDAEGREEIIEQLKALGDVDVKWGPCEGYTKQSEQLLTETFEIWARQFPRSKVPQAVRAAISRGRAMVHKIALLIAYDLGYGRGSENSWWIPVEALRFALKVIEWHNLSVVKLAGDLAPTAELRLRKEVLAQIPWSPVSKAQILRAGFISKTIKPILDSLLEERTIEHFNFAGTEWWVRTGEAPTESQTLLSDLWQRQRLIAQAWSDSMTQVLQPQDAFETDSPSSPEPQLDLAPARKPHEVN